jgi:hypothetical protein
VVVVKLFGTATTLDPVLDVGGVERIDVDVLSMVPVVVYVVGLRLDRQLWNIAVVPDVVKLEVIFPKLEGVAELTPDAASVENFRLRAQHRMNTDAFLKQSTSYFTPSPPNASTKGVNLLLA